MKPGESKLITINWIPDTNIDINWGTSKVYFSIVESNPIEQETRNNTIFKEFSWNSIDFIKYFVVTSYCPVTLEVTTPEGQSMDINSTTIPGADYIIDDFDGDGFLDNRIFIPSTISGTYEISAIPNSDALSSETFTLDLRANNEETILAKSVKISEIPDNPYYYVLTSIKENESVSPFTINFSGQELIINKTDGKYGDYLIEIFDLAGQKVFSTKRSISPVTTLPILSNVKNNSIYIIRISNKYISNTKKLPLIVY